MANYRPGQVIKFTYNAPPGAMEDISDRFKEVLVLHPNWIRKVHGIDLKRLTMAEREVLDAVFNPAQKGKTHKLPLVNDILRRMDPLHEIKNPVSFYSKFVKVFLRNKDAYRTYFPERMANVVVAEQTHVLGKVTNPNPLFHKVETKTGPTPPQPPTPMAPAQNRLELLKQRHAATQQGKIQKPKLIKPPRPR